MSITFSDSHVETGEVEFSGKHPDIFASHLSASFVYALAAMSALKDDIRSFRSDLSVQAYATHNPQPGKPTPIKINIAGQLVIPIRAKELNLAAQRTAHQLLKKAGYFLHGDYSTESARVSLEGITAQSPNLNSTTQCNKFADSCVVYGHYIAAPYGVNGTFPSLAIAQDIDKSLDKALQAGEIAELRPDGKVHVTVQHTGDGFKIREVYLSVATQRGTSKGFSQRVIDSILENTSFEGLKGAEWKVNTGGEFYVYFLAADFGMSKVKDGTIITGGQHQLGTDAVWGKCLYKASSTLLPYAFTLSRALCEAIGASYATVAAHSQYGQQEARLHLQEIESKHERLRKEINNALQKLPKDRDAIMELTGMPVNVESYQLFNDANGFHDMTKPWKRRNEKLERELIKALG